MGKELETNKKQAERNRRRRGGKIRKLKVKVETEKERGKRLRGGKKEPFLRVEDIMGAR